MGQQNRKQILVTKIFKNTVGKGTMNMLWFNFIGHGHTSFERSFMFDSSFDSGIYITHFTLHRFGSKTEEPSTESKNK